MKKIILSSLAVLAITSTLSASEFMTPENSKPHNYSKSSFDSKMSDSSRPDIDFIATYRSDFSTNSGSEIDPVGADTTLMFKTYSSGGAEGTALYLGLDAHYVKDNGGKIGITDVEYTDIKTNLKLTYGYYSSGFNANFGLHSGYRNINFTFDANDYDYKTPVVGLSSAFNMKLGSLPAWIGVEGSYSYGTDDGVKDLSFDHAEFTSIRIPLTIQTSENYAFYMAYQYSKVEFVDMDNSSTDLDSDFDTFMAGLKISF